jgi:carbon-monoxide dehydrogenase iron sulfur subunit
MLKKNPDGVLSMAKETQSAKPNARKFVSVDPSKCTGCGICEYVCTVEKCGTWNPLASRIRVIRLTPLLNATMTCRFCKDAPCVKACTEKALTQSETNGVLIVDESKCDACDWCIQACPYGGINIDPYKRIVIACDLCDGEPKCIEFCPEEALELVEDDRAAEKLWTQALQKIPSEIERLIDVVKKRKWATVFTEAEERAKRTTGKLEAISKRERFNKQNK